MIAVIAIFIAASQATPSQAPSAQPPTPAPQPQKSQQQLQPQQAPSAQNPQSVELATMDRSHPGWRQKIKSKEFNQWLSGQGHHIISTFNEAETANILGSIILKYDQSVAAQRISSKKSEEQQIQRRSNAEYIMTDVPTNVPHEQLPYIRQVARELIEKYPFLDTPRGKEALEYIRARY